MNPLIPSNSISL